MEIKAKLNKPYTENEKILFIIENNHQNGYEIKKTEEALEAWGKTEAEQLYNAKKIKYDEACKKAKDYLDSGNALFEFQEGKHIEATDGNIAKITAYALAYFTEQINSDDYVTWNTKEDETVYLSKNQIMQILTGLGQVQANVWSVNFPSYLQKIQNAQNINDINSIVIDYSLITTLDNLLNDETSQNLENISDEQNELNIENDHDLNEIN